MDNYSDVLHQMRQFGIELLDKDLPLAIDTPKRKTCGKGGKAWYKLYTFRPRAGGQLVLGWFGSYRNGGSEAKVDVDWKPLSDAERERFRLEREVAQARADEERARAVELAAKRAIEIWRDATPEGFSPYLQRKGLEGESCRYLPDGTLVIPLLRYDLPRAEALQAVQRVLPDGRKFFTAGFRKPRCAVRLGAMDPAPKLILVCEGYATGLSIRLGVDRAFPVFVALDAGNLAHVVPMLRELYPLVRLLICADDDWKTFDPANGRLTNPGKTAAKTVAREVAGCDLVWPVFDPATRLDGDTDFDDLRQRQGLGVVRRQLHGVINAMGRVYG